MPTPGKINSTLLRIMWGSPMVALACATDANMSLSSEIRDTTCKDTGGWRDLLSGMKSGQFTTTGLYMDDDVPADAGFKHLFTAWDNGDPVPIEFTTNQTGDTKFSCNAIITQLDLGSPGVNQNVTWTVTLEIAGTVTMSVIS